MPSPAERTRNNVRAGIFVTVTLLLAVACILVLTDFWKALVEPTHAYQVTFRVAEGVKNLKSGAEVRVGGVAKGRVESVGLRTEPGAPVEVVAVRFTLEQDVTLFEDAEILVTGAIIGADAWVEISDVGSTEPLPPGSEIEGYSGPGVMTTLLGSANARKAGDIIESVRVATDRMSSLSTRIADEDWPRWSGRIDELTVWATGATDRVDAIMEEGRAFVADTRAVVTDNRPRIDSIIANADAAGSDLKDASASAKAVAERVEQETVDKVHRLLDTGQSSLDSAAGVIERFGEEFELWAPELREALADTRLMAQQLKLAAVEVRRSPWKLLYRPTREELQHELLYEAARSFAMAVSDLRQASTSAERLMSRHGDDIELSPEAQQQIRSLLGDSLQRYETAQQRLIDVLLAE